ncbi:Rbs1p NDAI_0A02940 [Naumovozyma dairenensis CBS 421]|uniref:R3H domain-containing protein n=1 Tax=Naumovozyma dairenensis (strain ATCC 10597 / BCRC 20456 / CBS 421 / NBRC 0211 / NRRL Y-12639) TaxID=1071378 RepID=G0W3R3_NAUDC|nr:hypothetical protein NDAI_0A02940 [Naumovozyma dairenensis CBS 421]CCD22451.1 hypothetical protein NDAI_0A02940 [Naumovozyma dairenensis CBS 421]
MSLKNREFGAPESIAPTNSADTSISSEENETSSKQCGITVAMKNALFNKASDRDFIIQLENSMLSFIQSNDVSFQLAPLNSYYRLLAHQLADYHNLKHFLTKSNVTSLIIFKDEAFSFDYNKALLQNLKPTLTDLNLISNKAPESQKDTLTTGNPIETAHTTKYKLLKRTEKISENDNLPSNDNLLSSSLSTLTLQDSNTVGNSTPLNSSVLSLEEQRIERERRYEQRKHEIFDNLNNDDDGDDDDYEGTNYNGDSSFEDNEYNKANNNKESDAGTRDGPHADNDIRYPSEIEYASRAIKQVQGSTTYRKHSNSKKPTRYQHSKNENRKQKRKPPINYNTPYFVPNYGAPLNGYLMNPYMLPGAGVPSIPDNLTPAMQPSPSSQMIGNNSCGLNNKIHPPIGNKIPFPPTVPYGTFMYPHIPNSTSYLPYHHPYYTTSGQAPIQSYSTPYPYQIQPSPSYPYVHYNGQVNPQATYGNTTDEVANSRNTGIINSELNRKKNLITEENSAAKDKSKKSKVDIELAPV